MRILVGVKKNLDEWRDAIGSQGRRPRLPAVYTFGGAFYKQGHQLMGVNFNSDHPPLLNQEPFQKIYGRQSFSNAISDCDLAFLWGSKAVHGLLLESLRNKSLRSRRIVVCSFVWDAKKFPDFKKALAAASVRVGSRFARAAVLMTEEHVKAAEKILPADSIVKIQFGIDKDFYKQATHFDDVPEPYKPIVLTLLKRPFVIMPGDEQRLNWDAVEFVAQTGVPLIRVCQYADAAEMTAVRAEIAKRKLQNLFFIFEKIDYLFFRFLLRHAAAYAGFVDSSWQPAGWTVACEALASGLPIALYEGIVSREFQFMGIGQSYASFANREGGTGSLAKSLEKFIYTKDREEITLKAQTFIQTHLDLEKTGNDFVKRVQQIIQ